jgi:signal peptidase
VARRSRRNGELAALIGLSVALMFLARPRAARALATPAEPHPAQRVEAAQPLPVPRRPLSRRLAACATAVVVTLALASLATVVVGRVSGGWQLVPILSGSMAPAMAVGSLAIASEEPASAIRRGQVIVYRSPLSGHELIAHRVVAVLGRSGSRLVLTTRGDANPAADPWRTTIVGTRAWVVSARIPLLGYAAAALRQGPLLLLAGGLLTLLALANLAGALRPRAGRSHHASAAAT